MGLRGTLNLLEIQRYLYFNHLSTEVLWLIVYLLDEYGKRKPSESYKLNNINPNHLVGICIYDKINYVKINKSTCYS